MADYPALPGVPIHGSDLIAVKTAGVYTERTFAEVAAAVQQRSDSAFGFAGVSVGPAQAAVASTNALTAASFAHPIPANVLQVNSLLHVQARFKFSNTATPTLIIGVYHGGVATKLAATGAVTTTVSAVNWAATLDAYLLVNSIGASGSITAWGYVDLATSLVASTRIPIDAAAIAPVTVDTTTLKNLTAGVTWGASDPANTITCLGSVVQALNF